MTDSLGYGLQVDRLLSSLLIFSFSTQAQAQ